jgi:hypothetical protein
VSLLLTPSLASAQPSLPLSAYSVRMCMCACVRVRVWGREHGSEEQLSTSSTLLDVKSAVVVEDSYQVALAQLPVRKAALENFVNVRLAGLRRRSRAVFTVPAMTYTCGQGHTAGASGACEACKDGYKSSLQEVPCTPCPANSFTPDGAVRPVNALACRCREGFRPEGRSDADALTPASDTEYWAGRDQDEISCQPVLRGSLQGGSHAFPFSNRAILLSVCGFASLAASCQLTFLACEHGSCVQRHWRRGNAAPCPRPMS